MMLLLFLLRYAPACLDLDPDVGNVLRDPCTDPQLAFEFTQRLIDGLDLILCFLPIPLLPVQRFALFCQCVNLRLERPLQHRKLFCVFNAVVLQEAELPLVAVELGYFCPDSKDSTPEHPVFNRSVSLKDSYKPQA